jgi:hypothetical protein
MFKKNITGTSQKQFVLSVSVKMDEKVPCTTIPGPDETANTALPTCYDLAVHLQPL